MTEKQVLVASLLAILVAGGVLFYLEPHQNQKNSLQTDKTSVGCIERKTIVARGQDWVDKHVPYNQGGSHDGYRTDCSGFVSMCWELSKPGLTTQTMHTVSHSITKSELLEGDAIICESTHVLLFEKWSDSSKTHFVSM